MRTQSGTLPAIPASPRTLPALLGDAPHCTMCLLSYSVHTTAWRRWCVIAHLKLPRMRALKLPDKMPLSLLFHPSCCYQDLGILRTVGQGTHRPFLQYFRSGTERLKLEEKKKSNKTGRRLKFSECLLGFFLCVFFFL